MEEKYWIWLSRIEGLGCIRKNKLLSIYKTPEAIWNLREEEIINIDGFGSKIAKSMLNKIYRQNLDKFSQYMKKNQIRMINICDKEYPHKLKNIYDPPVTLYVKGSTDILNDTSISIVGCRDASEYGRNVSLDFAYDLAKEGICIISGMAKGIDSAAHVGALKAKGKTIAVLGSGLDRIYPKENTKLYNEIIKSGGAVVTEYVIGTNPNKSNFPARNRIISGLSEGVLVVEAKEKSGTLITVDFALDQGKDIYVVPGNITSPNSVGTNDLIKQGAMCVVSANDILKEHF